jgi:AraC-like DNA-binding protein
VRATASPDEFARAPRGRAYVSERFVHFCSARDVFGVVLWGEPSADDAQRLGVSLVVELAPHVPRHPSLVDARGLTRADPGAFAALASYVSSQRARLAEQVERLAIVRPSGVVGAVVAGFFHVLDAPYPVTLHDNLASAVAALGPAAAGLEGELARVVPRELQLDPLVARVRAVLAQRGYRTDVEAAAKALALSSRTLQRRLADAGTSFAAELSSARVDAARELLRGTGALTQIALDLGYASPAHFSQQFKRETGVSPSAWRKQQRSTTR